MLQLSISTYRFDRLAIGLSGLCLVHCLATAVLLGLLSAAGGLLGSPVIHEVGLTLAMILGAITNFFDTLGIGSFAPTMAWFKLRKLVSDRLIPCTMLVGHTLPTLTQAIIFLLLLGVLVDPFLLAGCVLAVLMGALLRRTASRQDQGLDHPACGRLRADRRGGPLRTDQPRPHARGRNRLLPPAGPDRES